MADYAIKKILVPVDFTATSETAVSEAAHLAQLIGAELNLLHVIEYQGYHFDIIPNNKSNLPTLLDLESAVEKKLADIRSSLQSKLAIKVKVHVTTGAVYKEIVAATKANKIDLLVMGTHGAKGYIEQFLGSNAQRVVTIADIPVLTFQNKKGKKGFKNILIPIDDSLHSREKVNIAITIARAQKAKIHVLGLNQTGDRQGWAETEVRVTSVEKILKDEKFKFKTTVVRGKNLATAAVKYAQINKIDLIVINSGHESMTNGIFLGAFAQQIVNHSPIPVLSFKHKDGQHYDINSQGFGID